MTDLENRTDAAGLPTSEQPTPGNSRLAVGVVMLLGGAVGVLAAAALLIEKVRSLQDPAYIPSCNISPIVACGSVMNSDQAEAFGFPNPILGVAGFAVLSTLGVVVVAGVELPRWIWLATQAGVTFGVVFVHWLMFQSIFRLGALCPYCMVVWIVTITAFVYVTRHNLTSVRARRSTLARPIRTVFTEWHGVLITAWCLAICAVILKHFWWYWSSL